MHLFCWHEFKANKFFAIGPLKMEFLSRNPDVVQVHHVFSDGEVEEISASNFHAVGADSTKARSKIKQKLSGLQAQGPDVVGIVSHLPGGHSETHMDAVRLEFIV